MGVCDSANQAIQVLQNIAGTDISLDVEYLDLKPAFNAYNMIAGMFGGEKKDLDSLEKKIPVRVKGKNLGTGAGLDDIPPKDPSDSGGNSGGGSEQEYSPSYDKYYNLLKKIERVQENLNKLQDEYSKMLDEDDEAYGAIANKQSSILSNLKNEIDYQKQLAAGRLSQINQLQAENSNLTGYASYD